MKHVGGVIIQDYVSTSPATPPASQQYAYPKSDGHYYTKNAAGVEYRLTNNIPLDNTGIVAGPSTGLNVSVSTQAVQALNNGVVSYLELNPSGGDVIVNGIAGGSPLLLNNFGLQTYVSGVAAGTLYLNNNGGQVASFGMRAVQFGPDTSARSTTSTSYAAVNGTTFAVTIPFPASTLITINITTLMGMNPVGAAKKGNITFEIKDGTSGGAALWNASDLYSIQLWDSEPPTTASPVTRSGSWTVNVGAPSSGVLWIRPMMKSNAGTSTLTVTNCTLSVTPSL